MQCFVTNAVLLQSWKPCTKTPQLIAMAKKPANGRREQSRRSNKLTPSKGSLKSVAQVSHLDGLSRKHALDVASSHKRRTPEEVKANLGEAALLESYFHGTGPRPELVINVWFGDTGVGFKSPDGHDGTPVVMPGVEWQDVILEADAARMEWRDESDKLRHPARGLDPELKPKNGAPPFDMSDFEREEQEQFDVFNAQDEGDAIDVADKHDEVILKKKRSPEMSGQLKKIYARLPPWVALEAGKEIDRGTLVKAVAEVALAFQNESGQRVIAANIHVETKHDLHIHLVYTVIVPGVVTKKPYTPKTAANKLAPQRKMAKALLLKSGIAKPSNKQVDDELAVLYASGELDDPRLPRVKYCYQRLPLPPGARERLPAMGPGYCSKTVLWEASGRDPAVVAVNEREMTFNFSNVVVSKAGKSPIPGKAPLKPEDTYIDYWLWQKWTTVIVSKLSAAALVRLPQSAKEHVDRYIRTGDSLPNPALETARKRADKYVVTQLDEFRKGLGGPESPSLKGKEKTVARAMQDIKATLDSIAKSEIIRGLKKAFAWLAGRESQEKTAEAVHNGIRGAITGKLVDGYRAILKVFGHDLPKITNPNELEQEVVIAAQKFKKRATIDGLELAWRAIKNPDVPVPTNLDVETLRREIQTAAANISGGLADLKTREQEMNHRAIEIETETKRFSRIPLQELCVKLGFAFDQDGDYWADIEYEKVANTPTKYRATITDDTFEIDRWRNQLGGPRWEKVSKGKGAIAFMVAVKPCLDYAQVCDSLTAMFPDREGSILLETLANKGADSWSKVFNTSPQPGKPAPQEIADPTKKDIGL